MSRNLIAIAAALSLAAVLPACQSTGSTGSKKTPAELCAEAKSAGDRNTPIGQATIKATCQRGGFTSETYWRELARQNECRSQTGRICAS